MIDLLLINPGNSKAVYQDLSKDFAAIEPPTWALLLAESCRKKGFNVKILDVNAERINNQEALDYLLRRGLKKSIIDEARTLQATIDLS